MKIATIVGARPQFIKAAPVSKAIRECCHDEYMIHTGQHYDHGMSQVFFEELDIPTPNLNLAVGSGTHGFQTGEMLTRIEATLIKEKPDWVLVFGDTNSTLAGALAARKLGISCGHIEAGLRSYDRSMPEETNRVVADHCADLLFAPTVAALERLKEEGLAKRAMLVGDVMYDSTLMFSALARKQNTAANLGLNNSSFLVATIHRAATTDEPNKLREIISTINSVAKEVAPVLMPMHPRTKKAVKANCIDTGAIKVVDPLSYLDMLSILDSCRAVITDSGGLQKEAYFAGKMCLTLREETEWVETVHCRANILCGLKRTSIIENAKMLHILQKEADFGRGFYGDGTAARKIVNSLSLKA